MDETQQKEVRVRNEVVEDIVDSALDFGLKQQGRDFITEKIESALKDAEARMKKLKVHADDMAEFLETYFCGQSMIAKDYREDFSKELT